MGAMRAVVQRVTRASVTVGDGPDARVVGAIGPGLCVLVGVTHTDDAETARRLAAKVAGLRVLAGDDGRMDRSVVEAGPGHGVLVVSQFTLYGDTSRGRRPGWSAAAPGDLAEPLVDAVVAELRAMGLDVATGSFGADMQVELVNDGPVTLLVEV